MKCNFHKLAKQLVKEKRPDLNSIYYYPRRNQVLFVVDQDVPLQVSGVFETLPHIEDGEEVEHAIHFVDMEGGGYLMEGVDPNAKLDYRLYKKVF